MHGLGRIEHYDDRNWRLNEVLPLLPKRVNFIRKVARGLGIKDKRSWRQWMFYYQGNTPACTGFGSATKVAAAPLRPNMDVLRALNPAQWYADNQAEDRKNGRNFSEGATTLAAMEVGKRYGHWSEYRWTYNIDDVLAVLHDTDSVIMGTNWYTSQWDKDSEGIVRIKPGSPLAGGHLFTLDGYDPRRGLVRHATTWNEGFYLHPVEDIDRMLREDGECVVTFETPLKAA